MTRAALLCGLTLAGGLGWTSAVRADVYVRAPFVRVQVDGAGVHVRAPFVNLFVPRTPPVIVVPPGTVVPGTVVPAPGETVLPPPRVDPGQSGKQPPQPQQPEQAPPQSDKSQARYPTMDEFVRNFQPKAGNYEVAMVNPLTGRPTSVRFTLPEGEPRVLVSQGEIEFDYGLGHSVRITFTSAGAVVRSR